MNPMFEKNIAALKMTNPITAARIVQAGECAELTWLDSKEGVPSAQQMVENRKITLASKFRPLEEAKRFAETADISNHPAIVVGGFGLGYHIHELIKLTAGKSLVIVYEPNAEKLRAVLSKIDYSQWLGANGFFLFTGEITLGDLTKTLEGAAATITQGTQFIYHPPTKQINADELSSFMKEFHQFVSYCRTNVATTLVNMVQTCRNLVDNLPWYTAGEGITELKGWAKDKLGVIVSAGPSLAKNVHLLSKPGIREKVVIIAVQTALKPLLAHGIRPHFVTSLDYHHISKRFYEDLPDLHDVTLIAEPKANKTILESFPGPIRVLENEYLDKLLGGLKRPMGKLMAGSTVAHLSFYFAQYLGCNPIAFIGQDLGFSEGLYYCPGTAIHDVWANELNSFNTLEMMEWRRIVRHKKMLHRMEDQKGQPIFSDEQMMTYLRHFERDFANAEQMVIDATEGGLPKKHTVIKTLEETLGAFAKSSLGEMPAHRGVFDSERLIETEAQLSLRLEQLDDLYETSKHTLKILDDMIKYQRDHQKMLRLFEQLERNKQQVNANDEVFSLVNGMNQIGTYRRQRADRAIHVNEAADEYEKQRMQIERDVDNINWLMDSCVEIKLMLTAGRDAIQTELTRLSVEACDEPASEVVS